MVSSCEHGNKPLGSIKKAGYSDKVSNHQLFI